MFIRGWKLQKLFMPSLRCEKVCEKTEFFQTACKRRANGVQKLRFFKTACKTLAWLRWAWGHAHPWPLMKAAACVFQLQYNSCHPLFCTAHSRLHVSEEMISMMFSQLNTRGLVGGTPSIEKVGGDVFSTSTSEPLKMTTCIS